MALSSVTIVEFVDCQVKFTVWPAVIVVRSALKAMVGWESGCDDEGGAAAAGGAETAL